MNRRLDEWVDGVVRANDGDVGRIRHLCFDDLTWTVRYMVVNTGEDLSSRNVLISVAALGKTDWKKRVFPVNLTLEQVRSSPDTDIDEPVSRQHERALHTHYAWAAYWGGGFYIPFGSGVFLSPLALIEAAPDTWSARVQKVDPHLRSTLQLEDCTVHATDGRIGHVEDCLVDDETWSIRYLVVNTRNWLPNRRVLVSPSWITKVGLDAGEVTVDLSREAVKKSPKFDPSKPVGTEYEGKLLSHLQKTDTNEWVRFMFHGPLATDVHVAGTFNDWDPKAIKLGDIGKGVYTATVLLPMGRHEYKFIVNGEWRNGPEHTEQVPNAFGTTNNVLVVGRQVDHRAHHHTFPRLDVGQTRPVLTAPLGV